MYPTEREERDWDEQQRYAEHYRRGWNEAMQAAGLPHLQMMESATSNPARLTPMDEGKA